MFTGLQNFFTTAKKLLQKLHMKVYIISFAKKCSSKDFRVISTYWMHHLLSCMAFRAKAMQPAYISA